MQHMRAWLDIDQSLYRSFAKEEETISTLFSFPPSSHRSIVCIRPHDDPAVWDWSVLISHGPISFDQSQICPTDPFPISRLSSAILIVDRRHVWKLDNRGKSVYTHGGDAAEQSFVVNNDRECSFGARIDHRSGVKTSQSRGMARESWCTKLMEHNASERERLGLGETHFTASLGRSIQSDAFAHFRSNSSEQFSLKGTQPLL